MSIFVFLGPSLDLRTARETCDAQFLPPAKMGDIFRLCEHHRPTAIGLIDGLFERIPAIWHKEILYAMSLGIPVYGGSSMGALRAAELHAFGMRGVGRIFQAYADGELDDDDEVALVHGPAENNFASQSEALVNIRFGLDAAQAAQVIHRDTAQGCLRLARGLFYPERSWPAVYALARAASFPESQIVALQRYVEVHRPNQKRDDALATLRQIAADTARGVGPALLPFHFESTSAWEALRAECRQAGTGPGSVRFDLLRNHARVFSQVSLPAGDLALLIDLVEAEAARRQIPLPDSHTMIAQFFARRDLATPSSQQDWCAANDVGADDLAELARCDFLLDALGSRQAPRLGRRLVDALKLTGDYPATRDHVQAKWRALDEHHAHSLRQADIGTPDEIDRWYAARTGARRAGSGARLGFSTQREFLDELNFEYFYTRLGNVQE